MNSKLILIWRRMLLAAAVLLVAGCAGGWAYREGVELTDEGQYEEGLEKIQQATEAAPSNAQYRAALITRRFKAVTSLLNAANARMAAGELADAEALYGRVLKIEPDNTRAKTGLKQIAQARRHAEIMIAARANFEAGDFASAGEKIRSVLLENPRQTDALALRGKIEGLLAKNKFTPPTLRKYTNPITLEFRDAPVKMVFDVLSTTTGVNFILDKDLRPEQRVSIFAKQVTFDKALSLLLEANQLDRKIINENTVVVYPRTPQKAQEYEELLVKTFYLANVDPKQTANMLRTILKVKDIYVDDRLNMLIVRDTPEIIRLSEKMIATQDLPEPEVLLDVTVVEVKRGHILDLGILPPTQLGVLQPAGGDGAVTLNYLRGLNSNSITVGPLPSATASEQITDLNVLANPRIRVRNHEKAKIHVGDRVPVISASPQSTTGVVSPETISYVDVGIKLEVDPTIYLEGDVAIKIALEVSSIVREITSPGGSQAYQIGTRNASTLLRLKDGETQLLAGLINDEDRTSITGWPGLAQLPILGRLFASHRDDSQKTEIVLAITPHIVRNVEPPAADEIQFWSGTATGGMGSYSDAFFSQGGMVDPRSRIDMPPPRPGMPPFPGVQPPVPAPPGQAQPEPELEPELEPEPEFEPEPEPEPELEPEFEPEPELEPEPDADIIDGVPQ